jgi:uncharacterized glyoxalase superfamily protein PhnB
MSIHPTLRYTDPKAAIAFLTEALGFVAGEVALADDGTVGHAELSFGDGVLMLGTRRADPGPWDTGRAVTYLVAGDAAAVDAHHARAVAAGATVVQELVDQPYGSREYAVTDPEGNVWSVGSYRPTPAG